MPLSSLNELLRALAARTASANGGKDLRDRVPDPNPLGTSLAAGAFGDRAEASLDLRRRPPRLSLGRFFLSRWRGGGGGARKGHHPGLDGEDDDEDSSPLPPYPEAYELQEVVGRGMTAVVYAARVVDTVAAAAAAAAAPDDENGGDGDADESNEKKKNKGRKKKKRVAVKIVDLDALSDNAMEAVLRETRLLGKLRHRCLMPPRASFVSGPSLWLVLPLAVASARDVLDKVFPGRGLPERSAAAIVAAVAEVLAYAHSQGVVHRDVKAQNVLLSLDNEMDDDEEGDDDGDDADENRGGGGKKVTSPPHPPLGRARLSDLGSGNAADALMSMRGGSFKEKPSAEFCCPSSSSFSPPGSVSASRTGGGSSGSGVGARGSSRGISRGSFTGSSLKPLPEIGEGEALSPPSSFQQQRQAPPPSPAPPPPSHAAAAGGAAAARAAAARRLSRYQTFAGSPAWMAPEVVEQGPGGYHGPACDVYSLGALLVELATGQPPLSSLPYETLMMEKLHGDAPSLDLRRTSGFCASAAELASRSLEE